MKSKLGRLSETEMEIMREIWAMEGEITVSRLLDIFTQRRGWKKSTLSTLLDRLIEKGYLRKTIHGKANIYTTLLNEEMYKKHETLVFLEAVHSGNLKSFVVSFADIKGLSDDDIAEISAWLDERVGSIKVDKPLSSNKGLTGL